MGTNILIQDHPEDQISKIFSLIGQPARIQILLVIGGREACVCHLEAVLGMRQAAISQHLMLLRKAGLVTPQRDGRNVFYQLTRPEIVGMLHRAANLVGVDPQWLHALTIRPVKDCPCPQCNPDMETKLTCKNSSSQTS